MTSLFNYDYFILVIVVIVVCVGILYTIVLFDSLKVTTDCSFDDLWSKSVQRSSVTVTYSPSV